MDYQDRKEIRDRYIPSVFDTKLGREIKQSNLKYKLDYSNSNIGNKSRASQAAYKARYVRKERKDAFERRSVMNKVVDLLRGI